MAATPLQDLEDAEKAYERVKAELEALPVEALSTMNVDIVSAASIALGVAERILTHRDRMAKLPEFDIRAADNLVDYAKATWFTYVNNLPAPEPADSAQLMNETAELRAKLLMWAAPLVGAGMFDQAAVAKIREGSGNKDTPSDLVALVGLYRSKWDQIKAMCGVTEQDLTRGSQIGPAAFALVSRREFQAAGMSDGSLRVRRAWTLLDRAYSQCRRALSFLRFEDGDADTLAPSLRTNSGPRSRPNPEPPAPTPHAPSPTEPKTPAATVSAQAIGGANGGPFMAKS
jgi:hypothetical protein